MPWSILSLPLILPAYLLVLFRVAGLLIATPMFSSNVIPKRVRVMFAAAAALVVFPLLLPTVPAGLTLQAALVGVVGEIMIGLLMGLAVHTLFLSAQLAGMVVGQQAGLSLGQTFNPLMNARTTTLGQLYFIVLFMVFLIAGGHRALVCGLLDSFRVIPLLSFGVRDSHVMMIVDLLHSTFVMALKLAGPCLIALFMATISLGFLSKTMPQLNILSVGFVVRILAVLVIGGLSLSLSQGVLTDACYDVILKIRTVFHLGPGMPGAD